MKGRGYIIIAGMQLVFMLLFIDMRYRQTVDTSTRCPLQRHGYPDGML